MEKDNLFDYIKDEYRIENNNINYLRVNYKLLIKFSTRSREEKFFDTFNKYIDYLDDKENTRFIVSIDNDDESMNNNNVINKIKSLFTNVKVCVGNSKTKIEAINADMDNEVFDIVLVGSDDMIPQIKGYDTVIRNKMLENFNDLDGVLFFDDGFNNCYSNTSTYSIMGYKYYKRFNYIYAPVYKSFCCDTEYTRVAEYLNKLKYYNTVLFKHMHPWCLKEEHKYDNLYLKNLKFYKEDKEIYDLRESHGWKNYCSNNKIRLHILGLPHTVTTDKFSHCAFTGKVLRFPTMMKSVGYEVYHYGIEGAQTEADKQFDILKLYEWNDLKLKSYKELHPELSDKEVENHLNKKSTFHGDVANTTTSLYKEFNNKLKSILKENYRSSSTDIVCLPFGVAHNDALDNSYVLVESGIGYPSPFLKYRIYESYGWLHTLHGKENNMNGCNYEFVIPNYFDSKKWPLSLTPKKQIGFFGRIYEGKGITIIVEIAKRFPNIDFIICGQGDPKPFLTVPNIIYKPPIHGDKRGEYLGSLTALLAPTVWIEPFCGVAVEAQLCGTPVITTDYGAQTETVEPFKTGIHCHTLADYCTGVQMALDGAFDREYIHRRAVKKYDMYNVAKKYDYAFKTIMDVHNGNGGWYSKNSYLELLKDD